MRTTDYIVLGLLNEEAMTGYRLKKVISLRFSFFWQESYGQIYPALHRLQALGWIQLAENHSQARRQKVYGLLPKGRAALKRWLKTAPSTQSVRFELLLKLYFSHLVDKKYIFSYLQEFEQEQQKRCHLLQEFCDELEQIRFMDNHEEILAVIDLGLRYAQASLDWVRQVKGRLDHGE